MKINISKNKFKEKHKGGCKNSEKKQHEFYRSKHSKHDFYL